MKPAGHIDPPAWMTAPTTSRVLAALHAGGVEARFVGGCVRDAVLGRAVMDIDIATPASPTRVTALLAAAGIKVVPTGVDHGTVTAVAAGDPFEITTLREDVATDGRWAEVAFTDDWTADAARRDFTMNAMFCDPDGTVYDPFGGWSDLLAGRVRFVGDPGARIREDALRLLRFFRFHAHYGQGDPDAAGLAAAASEAARVKALSAERVRTELLRLLGAPDPVPVMEIMQTHEVLARISQDLARISQELMEIETLALLIRIEGEMNEMADPLRRLGAVLNSGPNGAAAVAEGLRMSRQQVARLAAMRQPPLHFAPDAPGPALRAALYREGPQIVRDRLLLTAAARERGGYMLDRQGLAAALAEIAAWTPQKLPIDGTDVQALGVPRGPRVGRLLREVESWWIEHDFAPDRTACLARLRDRVEAD